MINCKNNRYWKRYYLMYRYQGKLQRRWFYFKRNENKFYNSIIKNNDDIILRKRYMRY